MLLAFLASTGAFSRRNMVTPDTIFNMFTYAAVVLFECFTQFKVSESLCNESLAKFMMSCTELMVTTADSSYTHICGMFESILGKMTMSNLKLSLLSYSAVEYFPHCILVKICKYKRAVGVSIVFLSLSSGG